MNKIGKYFRRYLRAAQQQGAREVMAALDAALTELGQGNLTEMVGKLSAKQEKVAATANEKRQQVEHQLTLAEAERREAIRKAEAAYQQAVEQTEGLNEEAQEAEQQARKLAGLVAQLGG